MSPHLIVITGPVAGGKSSTSAVVASQLRQTLGPSAVVGLDELYLMAKQGSSWGEQQSWERARQGAAALADAWFASGIRFVVVDGEFFTPEEWTQFRTHLHTAPLVTFLTLRASYEEVYQRAQGDHTRGASREPAFLKELHTHFNNALPFLQSMGKVINTEAASLPEIADQICKLVASNDAAG